jgi:hypothetical protein
VGTELFAMAAIIWEALRIALPALLVHHPASSASEFLEAAAAAAGVGG